MQNQRDQFVNVRFSLPERRLIEQEAQRQKLKPSTYIRRLILMEAEARGVVPHFFEKMNPAGVVSEAAPAGLGNR